MIKQLYMEIIDEYEGTYYIRINEAAEVLLWFNPETKTLAYDSENDLTSFLKVNEYQFRKLLHNKKRHTFHTGFRLNFSIIDGKDIAAYNDKNNLVVSDHGEVYVISEEKKRKLVEIYTDGSFNEKRALGAYTFLVKKLDGAYIEEGFVTKSNSSSLIELEAVIAALAYYPSDVRIVTDSQYVRKGITEWIIHWKLNDWMTANGTKAKNIDKWMRLENLCRHRYVEFEWVKAHSKHFENEYCDLKSKAFLSAVCNGEISLSNGS